MNEERTQKAIEVMQAFLDGKEIEWRMAGQDYDRWLPCAKPIWDLRNCEYRVKPVPKPGIVYINSYKAISLWAHETEEQAIEVAGLADKNDVLFIAEPYVRLSDVGATSTRSVDDALISETRDRLLSEFNRYIWVARDIYGLPDEDDYDDLEAAVDEIIERLLEKVNKL